MPRGKKQEQPAQQERVWNGFVRCDMLEQDVLNFRAWDVGVDECFGELSELLTEHKLSFAWNDRNQCYVASLTGTKSGHPNNGWCLSAFGGNLDDAIRVLWYKHSIMLDGSWQSNMKSRELFGGIG